MNEIDFREVQDSCDGGEAVRIDLSCLFVVLKNTDRLVGGRVVVNAHGCGITFRFIGRSGSVSVPISRPPATTATAFHIPFITTTDQQGAGQAHSVPRVLLLLVKRIVSNLHRDKYRGLIVHQGAEFLVQSNTSTATTTRSQRPSIVS